MSQFATVNIDAYTDADYVQTFRQQVGAPGSYFDFTGCTLHMMVRKRPEDVEVFLYIDSANGIPPGESGIAIYDPGLDGGPAGLFEFEILIRHDDLQELPEGEFAQSLIVQRPDGLYYDLWRGTFTNTIGPTRNFPDD